MPLQLQVTEFAIVELSGLPIFDLLDSYKTLSLDSPDCPEQSISSSLPIDEY